jgi:hypothetical protein
MTMYLRIIARLQDVWMLIVVYSTKRMTVSLVSVIFLLTFCHRDDKQYTPSSSLIVKSQFRKFIISVFRL